MRNFCLLHFVSTLVLLGQLTLVNHGAALAEINAGPDAETKTSQPEIIWHKRYRHIDPVTGYRTAYYRAALPKSVPGGVRITVDQAYGHFKNHTATFVDVMAHTGTGPDPIDGHWRLAKPRMNIPGSVWLADVGTGTLSKDMLTYFKSNLEAITKGDKSQMLVLYCTADCWMAWNAVRRASNWGYSNLLWFPDGTDEWRDRDYPLANDIPVPMVIDDE